MLSTISVTRVIYQAVLWMIEETTTGAPPLASLQLQRRSARQRQGSEALLLGALR